MSLYFFHRKKYRDLSPSILTIGRHLDHRTARPSHAHRIQVLDPQLRFAHRGVLAEQVAAREEDRQCIAHSCEHSLINFETAVY